MKSRKRVYKNKGKTSKNKKGGLLISNAETDLLNTHICNVKGVEKDSPGLELFSAVDGSIELNNITLNYLQTLYRSSDDKWFKFIIFNNDGKYYIYTIPGKKVNKHSVCMIQGLLDVTKDTDEYGELRQAVYDLQQFKGLYDSQEIFQNIELKYQLDSLIQSVNYSIKNSIDCMYLIAAGSGSINDDGSICINDKSGHYKPTEESMLRAKEIFENNIGGVVPVNIKSKEDKNLLKQRYKKDYENYSGICL